jgi:type VI secretion system secreted protein Hcp
MAYVCYLILRGVKQGTIKGNDPKGGGKTGSKAGLVCHDWGYEVLSPRNDASGLPTGKRQHNPIVIHREIDSASPKLLQALATSEVFTEVLLDFERVAGKPSKQKIELKNGRIIRITQSKTHNGNRSEAIVLAYEAIFVNGVESKGSPHLA